ncbi:MAG TPA: sigma-70 family RNA polymerase sigma factor [Nitrososphaera sp.]|nr:sigma-70 family RNA polymerase sigma factor [Nitrososphaera sp.]
MPRKYQPGVTIIGGLSVGQQTETLKTIIARAQRNDQQAYEQIYNRYADALYRYIYARCSSAAMAEEALSEVWLRVVQYLPHFRIPEQGCDQAFSSWLYTIARNQTIDLLRSERYPTSGLDENIMSRDKDLDHNVVKRDEYQALAQAVQNLTAEQREVISLRFQEELTSAEVARRTGRTESAVKALQHRAIAALARALGDRHGTDTNHAVSYFIKS